MDSRPIRVHAELEQAQHRLVQSERLAAIGQMVTGLAHEARNALQQIQASLDLLARRLREQPEAELLADIQKAEDRLLHLLEDVRCFAAPVKLECREADLRDIWQEAWEQLAPLRKDHEVWLREETGSVDLNCVVDSFSMERVFRNILENSLAACSSRSGS